jgi:hypothetical protein
LAPGNSIAAKPTVERSSFYGWDPSRLVLGEWLSRSLPDPPQTVHVAFMSTKPLFFYGKGQHGERVMAKKKKKKQSKSKT